MKLKHLKKSLIKPRCELFKTDWRDLWVGLVDLRGNGSLLVNIWLKDAKIENPPSHFLNSELYQITLESPNFWTRSIKPSCRETFQWSVLMFTLLLSSKTHGREIHAFFPSHAPCGMQAHCNYGERRSFLLRAAPKGLPLLDVVAFKKPMFGVDAWTV